MKKGVLIHGFHLYATDWENIVWGDPVKSPGRAAAGITLAVRCEAEFIFWGTGASEKNGMRESQYTLEYAIAHASKLPIFAGYDVYEIESILRPISHTDLTTQNTAEEVKAALQECLKQGVQELYLVSSPTHIARCHQEALKALYSTPLPISVYAHASATCFANSAPADVAILEPPHRGDDPMSVVDRELWPNRIVPKIFTIPMPRRIECLRGIRDAVDEFSRQV